MARLPPPSAATVQKLQLSTAEQQIGSDGASFSSIAFCSSRTALSLLPTTVTETTPSSGGSKAGSTAAECDTPLSWLSLPLWKQFTAAIVAPLEDTEAVVATRLAVSFSSSCASLFWVPSFATAMAAADRCQCGGATVRELGDGDPGSMDCCGGAAQRASLLPLVAKPSLSDLPFPLPMDPLPLLPFLFLSFFHLCSRCYC
ncbi:uncharacterized protein DS421_13g415660 [Arachis hypogaea]|nr:uncharacterized protein DS421_13g415660 [Arachis hypogaea]